MIDLETVEELIENLKFKIQISQLTGLGEVNLKTNQKYLELALYAKKQLKLDNKKKRGKMGGTTSPKKIKEKKKDPY